MKEKVLVVMTELADGNVKTLINQDGWNYEQFGMIACDLVRHIAKAYRVSEDKVWEWVEKERQRPTTDLI